MRLDLIQQVIDEVFVPRAIPLRTLEDSLRYLYRADPLRAERVIGTMYGQVFKNKEALYDAAQEKP